VNTKINHLAVWILVVVHQLIGWGWYTIFGEKWLDLHARTMTDIERTHNVGAYIFAVVTAIVVNYTLAWLISRLNATTAVGGLKVAWFAGSAFCLLNTSRLPCSPLSKQIHGR
jgi:hypothetical protein